MIVIKTIIIIINAILGLFVSALYYPKSPLFLFAGVRLDMMWLWSKYSLALAAFILVLAILSLDSRHDGRETARSIAAYTILLQGLLNVVPAILYAVFLHGAASAQLKGTDTVVTISYTELFLHVMILIIAFSSAAWLTLIKWYVEPETQPEPQTEESLPLAV